MIGESYRIENHSVSSVSIIYIYQCILVILDNIMLPTVLFHSLRLEHKCSSMSILLADSLSSVILECFFISLKITVSHVVFGLPVGFFTGTINLSRAFRAGVDVGSLRRCPNHESLLLKIHILHGSCFVFSYFVYLL